MPITAQLSTEKERNRRGVTRRELNLRTHGGATGGGLDNVSVLNLSASGLLIETRVPLAVGDDMLIALPESGMCRATVVWAGDNLFGCAFDHPVSDHVISAALLRSDPAPRNSPYADLEQNTSFRRLSGSEIRKLRLRKGISLVDFAKRMGVSRPTVWAWESGKSSPRASKLRLLSQVLDAAAHELGRGNSSVNLGADDGIPDDADTLASAIKDSKNRVAKIAGTTANHVKVIIEF